MARKESGVRPSGTTVVNAGTALVVGIALLAAAPGASAQPLRRDLSSYLLLTMRRASVKNLRVGSPCNVGVDCGSPTPKSKCGVLALGNVTGVDGGQVVADQVFLRRSGSKLWQLFRNNDSPLDNVQLVAPAPNPQPFDPPVVPGTCDDACNPDYAAMGRACGFPNPFPACDPTKDVKVVRGGDCPPFDTVPGNQQCDLPVGTYGSLVMDDGSRLNLEAGDYVMCLFKAGQDTTTTAHGTTILIPADAPAKSAFRANNGSNLGADCGDLRFLIDGETKVAFGRGGLVAAEVCAPQSEDLAGAQQHPDRPVRGRHRERRSQQLRPLLRRGVRLLQRAHTDDRTHGHDRDRHQQLRSHRAHRRVGLWPARERRFRDADRGAVRGAAGGERRLPCRVRQPRRHVRRQPAADGELGKNRTSPGTVVR